MPDNESFTKILVIGDDPLTADYLGDLLDPQRYQVEAAPPSRQGVAAARKNQPDLFIVDGLDSPAAILDICQIIRHYSYMPIMVISSIRSPGFVEQVFDAGADEHLTKPVSGSVLMAYINTLARRARAEKLAALQLVRGNNLEVGAVHLLTY